jgi:lipopolysaccharide transport system permease protein
MIQLIRNNRHLIACMVKRDLPGRFAGTTIGILWALILPLAQAFIFTVVFSVVIRTKTSGEYQQIPFVIWLLTGMLPWSMLAEREAFLQTSFSRRCIALAPCLHRRRK